MAIDFPNDPSPGATFTTNSKTWTFTDGKWALNVSVGGVRGPAGVAVQGTAPATTDVLWADTSITGTAVIPLGGSTLRPRKRVCRRCVFHRLRTCCLLLCMG